MPTTKNRSTYYRDRNERIVSFVLEDVELKKKLAEAAERDGRSVNSWILHYILPVMATEVNEQLDKKPLKRKIVSAP